MKNWLFILVVFVVCLILVLILQKTGCEPMQTKSAEEVKDSLELVNVDTKWVSKYYQPWPPKLILVPAISFQVRNLTDKPLRYVNFNANFRFKDDYENLGDSFLAAIRQEPVIPGELSELITLKSNYGVEGKTLDSFKDNPHWKIVFVKIFVTSKGSRPTLIGEWEVSRKIDFKEPEPVGIEIKEKNEVQAGKRNQ